MYFILFELCLLFFEFMYLVKNGRVVTKIRDRTGLARDSRPVPATKIRDRTECETGHTGLFFIGRKKNR